MKLQSVLAMALGFAALSAPAGAAVIFPGTGPGGNVCPAGPLSGCTLVVDGVETPAIAKFNENGGSYALDETSSLFPSVTGPEFSLTYDDAFTVSFTYTPVAPDPFLTGVVLKGGSANVKLFSIGMGDFTYAAGVYSGTLDTTGLLNNGGQQVAISNITFFDTSTPPNPGPGPIPLPAAAWLMLSGAGALGALKLKRKG